MEITVVKNVNNILDYLSLILLGLFIITGTKYMFILYSALLLFIYYFLREGYKGFIKLGYIIFLTALSLIIPKYFGDEGKKIIVVLGSILLVIYFFKRYKEGKSIW
jgi:hypothetical protein